MWKPDFTFDVKGTFSRQKYSVNMQKLKIILWTIENRSDDELQKLNLWNYANNEPVSAYKYCYAQMTPHKSF